MPITKLTSKGQLTVPREIRDKLGVQPGEYLDFEEKNGIFYVRKALKKFPFDKWVGMLKTRKPQKTDAIIKNLRGM